MLFAVRLCSWNGSVDARFPPAAAALTWSLPQQIRIFAGWGSTTQKFSTEQIVQGRKSGI